jgi:hypothetical protein
MARTKKSRSMKDRFNIKTGSKKDFIESEKMGSIPSKNKLAKHKNRQKSAYEKAEAAKKPSNPFSNVKSNNKNDTLVQQKAKNAAMPDDIKIKAKPETVAVVKDTASNKKSAAAHNVEQIEQDTLNQQDDSFDSNFEEKSGDDLFDMFNKS